MSKAKHTPLPWTTIYGGVYIEDDTHCMSIFSESDAEKRPVSPEVYHVRVQGDNAEQTVANAEFIIRCVNCHDDLLEACEAARQVLRDLAHNPAFEDDAPEFNAGGIPYKTIGQLVIAIAKATQGNY